MERVREEGEEEEEVCKKLLSVLGSDEVWVKSLSDTWQYWQYLFWGGCWPAYGLFCLRLKA